MKKVFSVGLTILTVVTLSACANNSSSVNSKASESKASSSSVKKSSKSESKASSISSESSTSSSSKVNLETPDFVLVTDEELANARTLGDMKVLYNNLVDNYIKYSKEIREKLPDSEKSDFDKQSEDSLKEFEASKQTFSDQLSQYGPDDFEIPAEVRDPFLQQVKERRDKLVSLLKLSYIMTSNLSKDK